MCVENPRGLSSGDWIGTLGCRAGGRLQRSRQIRSPPALTAQMFSRAKHEWMESGKSVDVSAMR